MDRKRVGTDSAQPCGGTAGSGSLAENRRHNRYRANSGHESNEGSVASRRHPTPAERAYVALRELQTSRIWFTPHSDALGPIHEASEFIRELIAQDNALRPEARPGPLADGTLGALRELTADLPDDTPIVVDVRKAHDPDRFYAQVAVEAESVDLTGRTVITLTVPEPCDVGL